MMPRRGSPPRVKFRWVTTETLPDEFDTPEEAYAWLNQHPEAAAGKGMSLYVIRVSEGANGHESG